MDSKYSSFIKGCFWLIVYLLVWWGVYQLPRAYFYLAQSWQIGLGFFALFFFVIPSILELALTAFWGAKSWVKAIQYGSILLALPFMLMVSEIDQQKLDDNHKKTIGVVQNAWSSGTEGNRVEFVYTVANKTYQSGNEYTNYENLEVGDTLPIIYLPEDPAVFRIQ